MNYLLERATLRILNSGGSTVGAGFILAEHLAVTCAHVVGDAKSGPGQPLRVEFYAKKAQQTVQVHELGWADTDGDDVAFLKLDSLPPGVVPLRLSTSKACGGHDFLTLGFPDWKAPDIHWPQGKLGGWVSKSEKRQDLLQFQGIEIVAGCSGGALLDLNTFKVVGMVSKLRQLPEVPYIGYATTPETLKTYWPALTLYEAKPTIHVRLELGKHTLLSETLEQEATLEWNPSFQMMSTSAFQAHPALEVPELRHLIGRRGELTDMLEVYWRVKEHGQGSILFLTGPYGYGTKALGRAFVDVLPKDRCLTAITRFWPEDLREKTLQDPRWRGLLANCMQDIQIGPDYLRQEPLIPLWPILAQLADVIHPMNYPRDVHDLTGLLRRLAGDAPLILLLEDIEHAHFSWLELIRYLAPEIQKDLPLIFVVTLHTEKNLGLYQENELLPSHKLALELTQSGEAEHFPLGRVTEEDVAAYLSLEAPGIAHKIHQLSGGIPLLVESMWQEFLHKRQVKRTGPQQMEWRLDAEWQAWGSGRDYIHKILDELYALEECSPWPKETMLEMLAFAAQEGVVFTPAALAKAFEVSYEALLDALIELTDGPDEEGVTVPGLVREGPSVHLLQKTIRYRFQPLVVWHALKAYEAPDVDNQGDVEKLLNLADSLRAVYGPFIGKVASRLAYLYKLAGNTEQAAAYLPILQAPDPFASLVAEAHLLLNGERSTYTDSRFLEVVHQLGNMGYFTSNPNDAYQLFDQMVKAAIRVGHRKMQATGTLRLGEVAHFQGDYEAARTFYQRAFEINEQIGRKHGKANNLFGLGQVAEAQGDSNTARLYYEQALVINEEIGRKQNIMECQEALTRLDAF